MSTLDRFHAIPLDTRPLLRAGKVLAVLPALAALWAAREPML